MKAQLTLTPAESKRLIAMAVKEHPAVKKALKEGIVAIGLGLTNSFVVEEILGEEIEKERYVAGFIDERGACVVPESRRLKDVVLEKGKRRDERVADAVKRMKNTDVFIKGANAIDPEGMAGVMMASPLGGTIATLGILKARGTRIIIPVGLEKLIPHSINDISTLTGIYEMDYSNGIPVGIMPVCGELITEIEAFDILTGTEAVPIGSGGVGNAYGSKTFLLTGSDLGIKKAVEIVKSIKGETEVRPPRGNCMDCEFDHCPMRRKDENTKRDTHLGFSSNQRRKGENTKRDTHLDFKTK